MWALFQADLYVLVWQPAPGRGGVRGRWQQCGGGGEETGATPRRKAGDGGGNSTARRRCGLEPEAHALRPEVPGRRDPGGELKSFVKRMAAAGSVVRGP